MSTLHQLEPGKPIVLSEVPSRADDYHTNRDEAEAEFKKLRKELREWQARLYAENKQSILMVLQAMDAGGKDGTIRNIFQGVNPQGVAVTSFKVPSKLEMSHDFLWRIHKAAPEKGKIRVFNRSHYEDVLVVRVHNYVPESVWQPRYEMINNFEALLAANNTKILKFYLHISPKEQKKRFQDRLDDTSKHWKFSLDDLEKAKHWDDYMLAYQDALNNCTTEHAPWHVIPADQKWYRNLAIMRIMVNTLKEMDPQYPINEDDLSNIVIE